MYLITGAKGQLGLELAKLLPEAILADLPELDITDAQAVCDFVQQHAIDTIINCAAYTAVDAAESNEELAYKINAEGVGNLAKSGARLVHISTDYVFDGRAYRPYDEDCPTCPISAYGRTKLAGEQLALEYASTCAIIRTAWLYSTHGKNFVKSMQYLCGSRDTLSIVADQVGSPTSAADLAALIVHMLPQIKQGSREIYHFSNEGICSWYDFAVEIAALSGLCKCAILPIKTEDYPTAAARPFYSVLDKSKIKRDFGLDIPHWKRSLARCIQELAAE